MIFMSVTIYNVEEGKDRATIALSGETKVIFSFYPNVIAVEAVNGEALVSLDKGATTGDDGCDTLSEGQNTRMNPVTGRWVYVTGTGTVRVWAGRSGEDCPFEQGGKGGVKCLGTTTTALTDGSTANPITIDGKQVMAKQNDIAFYQEAEFMFNGTRWSQFGDLSGLGTLAYKNGVSVSTTDGGVTGITSVGTLPSMVYDSNTKEITFNAGTLPTADTAKTFLTGATAVVT